jgi:hypothetical protein
MKIETMHTLTFQANCVGNEQHAAMVNLVTMGAKGFGMLPPSIAAMPLQEGTDPMLRSSMVAVTSANRAELEVYAKRVDEALTFLGVVIDP